MARSATLGPAFLICLLLAADIAYAGCADVAGPGVYWRRCQQSGLDLQQADLTGATLRDSSFANSDLTGATLVDADMRGAKLISTTLHDARLDGANLTRADLTNALLNGASLIGADLTLARLFRADLSNADLTDARLDNADFLKAKFDGATWIDGITVCGEDSIGRCLPARKNAISETEPSG